MPLPASRTEPSQTKPLKLFYLKDPMPTTRRTLSSSTFALVLSSLVLIMPLAANAQDYPSKPIRIVEYNNDRW